MSKAKLDQVLYLSDCVAALNGNMLGEDILVSNVSTDSRKLQAGDVFLALTGPNHDAHDHCQMAENAGAAGFVVERQIKTELPQLIVDDSRLALGLLAKLWCAQFQVPVIAVTGSNGKTTVKEMIKSILLELGPVLATEANLNNEIGLPLTLLKMRAEHQYVVVEMGANHVGEIGYLSKLAQPDVALITNISSAHLEGFGSVEAIAAAKSEIFEGVPASGYAVLNGGDMFFKTMKAAASHCQRSVYGLEAGMDVRGGFIAEKFTIKLHNSTIQPSLKLLGEHNRVNAVAAAAVAFCLDIQPDTIRRGLEATEPVAGRLQRRQGKSGATVIDDTYNANPASVLAAIKVLSEQTGDRVLVLGDMRELGVDEISLHADMGNAAREAGVQHLYTVGPLAAHSAHAFGESGVSFDDKAALLEALSRHHPRSTTFLVKGSRGSRMEEVVDELITMRGNGTTSGTTRGEPVS